MNHMNEPHPPKFEAFDPESKTNTDPKGIVRDVDEFRVRPFGLYMARPTPGHAQFHYLESWLVPELGLRITDFWFKPGRERDQDFYLDIVEASCEGSRWVSNDLYLDIVLREGRDLHVLDTDELLAAAGEGMITAHTAGRALETAYSSVEAIAKHGYRLEPWLSTLDIELTWLRH